MDDLIKGINEVFPDQIEGVYLTGSIPLQDFYARKSDIDFIVICQSLPVGKLLSQFQRVHNRIQKRLKQPKLSGFYITKECLHLGVGKKLLVPGVHEGKVRSALWGDGLTAITLKELKTTAFTFSGAPAQSLPIETADEEVDRILFENINSYWRKWINRHTYLPHRYSLLVLFPWFSEWSILGVARQLYTLQTGKITSKLLAGYYALDYLPSKYHKIDQQAIQIRKECKLFQFAASVERATKTIECVNHIIDCFNIEYQHKYSINCQ